MVKLLQSKSRARYQNKMFVVEGPRMVVEAPIALVKDIYISESYMNRMDEMRDGTGETEIQSVHNAAERLCMMLDEYGDRLRIVSDDLMSHMSDTEAPQGVLATVSIPEYHMEDLIADTCSDGCGGDRSEKPLILVLENIQDPGNLGMMFRTAEGAGVTGIVMSKDTVDVYNPKTVRSTMGSLYRMPFLIVDDICEYVESIKRAGVSVYAAHLMGRAYYDEMDYRAATAFMIGNEGNGLTDEAAKMADEYIRIPMEGQLESLNAAMASGILAYEANRQRRI